MESNERNRVPDLPSVRSLWTLTATRSILNGAVAAGTGNLSDKANYSPKYFADGESVPEGWLSMPDPIDPSKTLIIRNMTAKVNMV